MAERIILLVDMDAFFASCEQATDPRLRGKPVIVCGNWKNRSVVAACSYEAKGRGIENGMSIPEALVRCPSAILIPGDPEKYTDLARRIFAGFERFTPLMEVVSIDEAFLDVTDTWARFGTPESISRQIQKEIESGYRLSCTVGIGPNKLLAKLAAKLHKPRGIGRIRPEQVPGCLVPLPVDKVSRIGPQLTRALLAMGITTLGELAQVPLGLLARRFGFTGEMMHRMALGIDGSPVLAVDAPDIVKSMGHAYTLDRDTSDPAIVRGTLLKLAEKVGRRLRAGGYSGRTVCVTIRWKDFTTFSRQRTVGAALDDGLTIYRTACRLLEEKESIFQKPVRLIGVSVSSLAHLPGCPELWEEGKRLRRLMASLDRVNDLYGEETVTRAGALVPFVQKTRGYFDRRWYDPD